MPYHLATAPSKARMFRQNCQNTFPFARQIQREIELTDDLGV